MHLNKKNRLRKQKEFLTLKKGKRIYTESFIICWLPAENFKVGITIPRKFGNAVKRNRLKRILRILFAGFQSKPDFKYHINVISKFNKKEKTFCSYSTEISKVSKLIKRKMKHGQ